MNILSIESLSKNFGKQNVISDLTFSVEEGTVYGFLGQNGAGKTTTMKMILGLLKPTSGDILVCGETVKYGETKTNRNIGFLPDVPEFYNYMNAYEYLKLCGDITGLKKKIISERSQELLSLVGLEKEKKRIGGFSRGMKQRLGIAQALLNEPKLLICDEPTSALDPIGRKEILDILLSIKGKTTILFSTHILADVERICDHVAVLHKGKIVLNGTLSELKHSQRQDRLIIEFSQTSDMQKFLSNSSTLELVKDIDETNGTVTIKSNKIDNTKEIIFNIFAFEKVYPKRVEVLEPTLESLFIEVVK